MWKPGRLKYVHRSGKTNKSVPAIKTDYTDYEICLPVSEASLCQYQAPIE